MKREGEARGEVRVRAEKEAELTEIMRKKAILTNIIATSSNESEKKYSSYCASFCYSEMMLFVFKTIHWL